MELKKKKPIDPKQLHKVVGGAQPYEDDIDVIGDGLRSLSNPDQKPKP